MPSAIRVTRVQIDSDNDGVVAEIRITRPAAGIRFLGGEPVAADIPEDIRQALVDWLTR